MSKKSNVYKDNKGWYFKASLGNDPATGKRRTKTKRGFTTEKEAKLAYMKFMLEWQENHFDLSKNDIKFEAFRDTVFLPWYKSQVRPNTYNRRECVLNEKFLFFEGKNMRNISKLDVQQFQNKLCNEKLSGSYINLLFSLGGMIWDRAKIFNFVDENPFRVIGRVRNEPKKIRFWTLTDFQKFEEHIFPSELEGKIFQDEKISLKEYHDFFHYLYFRFLFYTGLRFGESASLLWENVDLKSGLVKVCFTVGNASKKKSEQYFSPPKTRSSNRELYIDTRTLELLKSWNRYQQMSGDISLVFSHDDRFLDQGWMWKKFRSLQESYSLPFISLHDLRHSHASLLIFLGENAKMIQKRLGHTHVEMTLGTYSHLYPNQEAQLVNRLEKVSERKKGVLSKNDVLT